MENVTSASEVKQLGRPVNENSVRQQTLKMIAEKRAAGLIKRGRPAAEGSKSAEKLCTQGGWCYEDFKRASTNL